MDRNLLKGYL